MTGLIPADQFNDDFGIIFLRRAVCTPKVTEAEESGCAKSVKSASMADLMPVLFVVWPDDK